MSICRNPNAPHKAIIWIRAEVHEILKTGECSGMADYKIASFPIYLDGDDQATAIRRLNETLDQLKCQCKEMRLCKS